MNKPAFYTLLAVIGGLAIANVKLSAEDPKPAPAVAGDEYITIQYAGRFESHVLYGGGKAQFFPELANVTRPERTDERVFLIHTLINKFSQQGYQYVDTPEPSRVIMKKKSGF